VVIQRPELSCKGMVIVSFDFPSSAHFYPLTVLAVAVKQSGHAEATKIQLSSVDLSLSEANSCYEQPHLLTEMNAVGY